LWFAFFKLEVHAFSLLVPSQAFLARARVPYETSPLSMAAVIFAPKSDRISSVRLNFFAIFYILKLAPVTLHRDDPTRSVRTNRFTP
jgi:hypothetical protein